MTSTIPELTVRPDAVDLFLFSAAVGLAHRIHYDEAFARSEGLDGLPVHGPLQGAYLSEAVSRWARPRGGRLVALSLRHRRPVYAEDTIHCRGRIVEGSSRPAEKPDRVLVDLELELVVGENVCATGSATVELPAEAER